MWSHLCLQIGHCHRFAAAHVRLSLGPPDHVLLLLAHTGPPGVARGPDGTGLDHALAHRGPVPLELSGRGRGTPRGGVLVGCGLGCGLEVVVGEGFVEGWFGGGGYCRGEIGVNYSFKTYVHFFLCAKNASIVISANKYIVL